MRILAIETSCDETGIAVIEASGGLQTPKFEILKSLVASQIKTHRPFGGVVPNLAKREHLKNLPLLLKKLDPTFRILDSIDMITVTVGPGLEPALWTGINFAKELAAKYDKPLVGANHLEGHLYSFLLPTNRPAFANASAGKKSQTANRSTIFPAIALIVSGGHTIILKMDSFAKWKRLGETRDDAAGEAFDKVARILELPYPGGPEIEKLSREGNSNAIQFPRPMMHDNSPTGEYEFSFSGLKTAVLYYLRDHTDANRADIAASFQQAAVDVLVAKTIRAAKQFGAKSVLLSGGVASNKLLRKTLGKESEKIGCSFFVPDLKYNQDNAAMIAVAGYMTHLRKKSARGRSTMRGKYKLAAKGDLDI